MDNSKIIKYIEKNETKETDIVERLTKKMIEKIKKKKPTEKQMFDYGKRKT